MDPTLLSVIHEYAENTLTPELRDEIIGSLTLCDAFEYQRVYELLPDVLYDTDLESSDVTQQKFLTVINEAMDALLTTHALGVDPTAELHVKNQILSVLFRLQHLEDVTPVLRITEASFNDEEKVAKIVEVYSTLSELQVMEALQAVESIFIPSLQSFLYDREKANEAREFSEQVGNADLLKQLKAFFSVHGSDNLANQMLENDLQEGHVLSDYLPYITEFLIVDDDLQTAKNFLSLCLMASDAYLDPLSAYHTTSEPLFTDRERLMRVEAKLADLLNTLRHFMKAQDDSKRVSAV